MPARLQDKIAVVTGGGSGIGRATAIRFAEEGAHVVVADLHPESGGQTVAAVRAAGRKGIFQRTDTSSAADCEALAEAAVRQFGRIDLLVAAAGISHARYAPGDDPHGAQGNHQDNQLIYKPVEYWEKVLAVNLTGVMLTDRFIARAMVENGWHGSIVNIASAAAKVPLAGSGEYSVSKAGVWMLTKVLALELAPHKIRVNAIGPGIVETPMTANVRADERRLRGMVASTPIGRLGQPEDIANAALFLSSEEASFFTGELIFCDGGLFTG